MSEPALHRIAAIVLDEESIAGAPRMLEQEREVAIHDLLENNHFAPEVSGGGAYHVRLHVAENRLVFDITYAAGSPCCRIALALKPFRRIVKEYLLMVESYNAAIRGAPRERLETLDMGRRGLHNEGAQLLMDELDGKAALDFATARRLFTLLCVLHMRH